MIRNHYPASLFLALSLCLGMTAHAQQRPLGEMASFNQALIAKAIRAMDGYAEGVVRGQQEGKLKQMTRSDSPILAKVQVVQRFQQFECARVEINVSQADVPTIDGGVVTFSMPTIGLNICTDGNPPDGSLEELPKGNWQLRPEFFIQ